jgi:hypothetical protein
MSRKRPKKLKPTSSQPHRRGATEGKARTLSWILVGAVSFLGSAGFLLYFSGFLSEFLRGDTTIGYSQPLGDATELSINNTWPMDRKVRSLRFAFVGEQQYVTKKATWARIAADGTIEFPESPKEFERHPASEFVELDGSPLLAKSSIKFRLPPLINSPVHEHRSGLVEIALDSEAHFLPFRFVEACLGGFGLMKGSKRTYRFLISSSHWTPVAADFNESVRALVCRERWSGPDGEAGLSSACKGTIEPIEWGSIAREDDGDDLAAECTKKPEVKSPFSTKTVHHYLIGGKLEGTIPRADGTGRPLIKYGVIAPGTKVICESGRFISFTEAPEAIRSFRRLPGSSFKTKTAKGDETQTP